MNLEEYPAFRLGRRSRRPELRYTRSRTENGRIVEQLWVVRGAEGLGLPGPFEQDLYVALLVLFTEQGLPGDGRIRFTRNHIAGLMGISNSGRGYELIEQGLSRLAAATVHTEHAFYRPGPLAPTPGAPGAARRSGPAERLSLDFHILEEVRVYERNAPLFDDAPDESLGDVEDTAGHPNPRRREPRVERARPFELSMARLGLPLVQSYERRYTKPLDASFYFSLERPLSKRLYRYVDKVRNGRGSFEIGLRALADVLGLEYRYPSDIKDGLAGAHAELRARGYLLDAQYAPLATGAGEKVGYTFRALPSRGATDATPDGPATFVPAPGGSTGPASTAPAAKPEEAAPSSPPPLQLALEALGVSSRRAASLVSAFPAAHIQERIDHVHALRRDSRAQPLRNPGGYLVKAIEDGYTVTGAMPPPSQPVLAVVPQQAPETITPETVAPPAALPPGLWGELAGALRERLSAATYAAWVLPVHGEPCESPPDSARAMRLVVPSSFAYERWRRDPLAHALAGAAGDLRIQVTVEVAAAPPENVGHESSSARTTGANAT